MSPCFDACYRYGLPVLAPKGLTLEKLMEKMAVDKPLGLQWFHVVPPSRA